MSIATKNTEDSLPDFCKRKHRNILSYANSSVVMNCSEILFSCQEHMIMIQFHF